MKVSVPKMTIEELDRLPDDGNRYELIEGELLVSPAPRSKHQMVSTNLTSLLHHFAKSRSLGRVIHAAFDVTLGSRTRVQPDIVFIARDRLHLIRETGLFGAPDLAVEILSESTWRVDEGDKLELYQRAGVQEYWIADPDQRSVTVYRFAESGEPHTLHVKDALTSPLFPGLEIPLSSVFDY